MLLKTSKAVDLRQLVIGSGRAVWVAYLDIYVLDADGCLLDVCLLAAAASLASLKALPSVSVDESGKVGISSTPMKFPLPSPARQ